MPVLVALIQNASEFILHSLVDENILDLQSIDFILFHKFIHSLP